MLSVAETIEADGRLSKVHTGKATTSPFKACALHVRSRMMLPVLTGTSAWQASPRAAGAVLNVGGLRGGSLTGCRFGSVCMAVELELPVQLKGCTVCAYLGVQLHQCHTVLDEG